MSSGRDQGGSIFRPDIEGLRGVAVLLVVIFHAGLGLPGGFIGVDVFFVISGFLITGLLMRERESSGRIDMLAFYARRVRRLAPAAIVVLAVTLPVAYGLLNPLDRVEVLLDGAAAALSVGNIRFAMAEGDYFAAISAPSPFLHFWSLAVEEQFYLVWPALLLLAAAFVAGPRIAGAGVVRLRIAVGGALAIVFAGSLAASIVLTHEAPAWAFYSLPTRAFELAAGGLLALAATGTRRLPSLVVVPLGWLGLAAICGAGLVLDSAMAFPGALALVPTLATVGVMAAGDRRFGPRLLLSVDPLRFVGRISYSLYLWHWPILVLAGVALGFDSPGLIGGLVLIGMSIAAATLSWALVEEPFRRGLPALASRPGRTVFAGVTAMLAVVVVANGMVVASNQALTEAANGRPNGGTAVIEPAPTFDDPADGGPVDEELPEVVLPGEPRDDEPGDDEPTARPTDPLPTPTFGQTLPPEPTDPPPPTGKPTTKPEPTGTPKPTPRPSSTIVTPPPPKATPTPSDWALSPDVRPALADARNDKERIWFERCLGNFEHVAPRNCVYGDKDASYTIALVGDSHGAHFFPAFEWVAQQRGWRLLVMVKVSCSFIDMPLRNIYLKREYVECAEWNKAVIERLNAAPPDLTVVAMSHWIFPLDPANDKPSIEAAGVARMIDRLNGRTVILADSPHSAMDVPACLSANTWDIRACSTPRSRALSAHAVMEQKAASLAGVAMIDLAARICTASPCPAVVDNMIVYRDEHHLTATFSRSLGPALARLLDQVR